MLRYKLIFCFIFVILFHFTNNTFAQESKTYKIKTVVIDPGHGGKDPGAIGKISYEKDLCLSIALLLGGYIEENIKDVKVIYTRKTDVFIPLHKRAEIANSNNADLFISIHVNSTVGHTAYGTSTYVMGLHKSDDNLEVAKTENSVIYDEKDYKNKYSGFDPDSPETYIILNLYQNANLEKSLDLAQKIQYQFKNRAGRRSKGVKQAGLLVLWQTTMPSVLIETGFISNLTEEQYLNTTYGQEIIASAIFSSTKPVKICSNADSFVVHNLHSFPIALTITSYSCRTLLAFGFFMPIPFAIISARGTIL